MNRRHQRQPDPEVTLRRELSEPVAVPDLTTDIMDRLGFARIGPGEARRQRRRRGLRNATMVLAAAGVLGAGVHLYRAYWAVRTPAGPTIPAALLHDVELRNEQFEATFRTLRRLAPPPPPEAPPSGAVDPSAMAPVRWI